MSSKDNNNYVKVRTELSKLYKPSQFTTLYNNLMSVYHSTEDVNLKKLIWNYCNLISDVPRLASSKLTMAIQNTITNANEAKLALDDYCMCAVSSAKPEWQIIAERNGWRPSC